MHKSSQLFDGGASCLRWWSIEAKERKKRKLDGKAFLSHEHVRPEQKKGKKKIEKTCHLVEAFFRIRLFFR